MTKHKDLPYISHILTAIEDIEKSTEGVTKEQFINNKDLKDANIRRIEILGEATKNISMTLKLKHPKVEWKEIIGTRDKMIHHYFGVNIDIVWEIIKKDLPVLKKKLLIIKESL